jgi:hypothetical protein
MTDLKSHPGLFDGLSNATAELIKNSFTTSTLNRTQLFDAFRDMKLHDLKSYAEAEPSFMDDFDEWFEWCRAKITKVPFIQYLDKRIKRLSAKLAAQVTNRIAAESMDCMMHGMERKCHPGMIITPVNWNCGTFNQIKSVAMYG